MCVDLTSLSDGKQVWFLWTRVPSPRAAGGPARKHSLCGRGGAAARRAWPWPLLLACLRPCSRRRRGARERWKEVVGVCARSLVSVLMHMAQVPSWSSWGCSLKTCIFHTGCPPEPATEFMWCQLRGEPALPSIAPRKLALPNVEGATCVLDTLVPTGVSG